MRAGGSKREISYGLQRRTGEVNETKLELLLDHTYRSTTLRGKVVQNFCNTFNLSRNGALHGGYFFWVT